MANTKSAKKAVKVNERRRQRNQATRSAIKTAFKKATEAVKSEKGAETRIFAHAAYSLIDKSASRGIVHPNTAARKKSRLAKKLKQIAG